MEWNSKVRGHIAKVKGQANSALGQYKETGFIKLENSAKFTQQMALHNTMHAEGAVGA